MKHIVSNTGMVHKFKECVDWNWCGYGKVYLTACNRTLVKGEIYDRRPANAPRCWYCYKGK